MGWRNHFSSCADVSVFCSGRKQVLVLHTPYVLRVPYSSGAVLVLLVLAGNSFWYVPSLVYNTVVRLCQFCCGGKANLVRIFLLNPRIFFLYFLLCMDLQPYSHDCFSKISRTLFDFLNNTLYSLCTQSTIQLWHCFSFFGSGGKQFLVCTYLVYNTVVRLCHLFLLWRES